MTDAERATTIARDILGDVATAEIVACLNAAFAAVRLDERNRVLQQLRESIRDVRTAEWAEQSTWA